MQTLKCIEWNDKMKCIYYVLTDSILGLKAMAEMTNLAILNVFSDKLF